jgi:hypothetical protein
VQSSGKLQRLDPTRAPQKDENFKKIYKCGMVSALNCCEFATRSHRSAVGRRVYNRHGLARRQGWSCTSFARMFPGGTGTRAFNLAVSENDPSGARRAGDLILWAGAEAFRDALQNGRMSAVRKGDAFMLFPLGRSGPMAFRTPETHRVTVTARHDQPSRRVDCPMRYLPNYNCPLSGWANERDKFGVDYLANVGRSGRIGVLPD